MNKSIAVGAGPTEDEVNGVMSLLKPVFVDAIAGETSKLPARRA